MPSIISANRLIDGRIVFLAPSGEWTHEVAAAARYADQAALSAGLARAHADQAANVVVEIEAVALREEADALPITLRDRIRLTGPSIFQSGAPDRPPAPSEHDDVSI